MKQFVYSLHIVVCAMIFLVPVKHGEAQDIFPLFTISSTPVHLPIDLIQGILDDPPHEVDGYIVYTVNGQFFPEAAQGHIQTLAEGFSGSTDKGSPWKTLTELLAAYQTIDITAIQALYTADSQGDLDALFSDPQVQNQVLDFMQTIIGMDVWLGFEFRGGFLAFVNIHFSDSPSELLPYYFVQDGSEYWVSTITIPADEVIDANIVLSLQQGHSVADLLKPPVPLHALTVEKSGTGDGTVAGSGINCGPDCIEVYREGVVVFLKAEPDAESVFGGWLVDGNPPEGRIEMTKDTIVTAIFHKEE